MTEARVTMEEEPQQPDRDALAIIAEEDMVVSAKLARRERSMLERLQDIEEAAVVWERRVQAIESCRAASLRATLPRHWVAYRDKEGVVSCTPSYPACQQIAEYYGIDVFNIRPRKDGLFTPLVEKVERTKADGTVFQVTILRAACDVECRFNGHNLVDVESSVEVGADFTGSGHLEDARKSLYTAVISRAIRQVTGTARIPAAELDRLWSTENKGKSTEQCVKGRGFGSSEERQQGQVASTEVVSQRGDLRDAILECVNGDEQAAKVLTKKVTGNPPKFDGYDDAIKIKFDWQLENAWKKLRGMPEFKGQGGADGGN